MQFRKTMKNKKRFSGGLVENLIQLFNKVVGIIKGNTSNIYNDLNKLCGEETLNCSQQFIALATDQRTLALAGISAAAYAGYLLYGTREKQDEILKKIEKIKKERRESEESSDTNYHRDSKYDDSSLSDDSNNDESTGLSHEDLSDRISRIRILISRYTKPSKKLEELHQQLKQLKRQLRTQQLSRQHSKSKSNRKSNRKSTSRR